MKKRGRLSRLQRGHVSLLCFSPENCCFGIGGSIIKSEDEEGAAAAADGSRPKTGDEE